MTSTKYIGMDVHKESISIAVRNDAGKIVMECVIETKASVILDFIHGLRGELQVTFEEGTWATWLFDLLKPHVTKLVVCDPRKNARQGNKNDRIDARELADRLYMNKLNSVYHFFMAGAADTQLPFRHPALPLRRPPRIGGHDRPPYVGAGLQPAARESTKKPPHS
jgi:hypothetical protein